MGVFLGERRRVRGDGGKDVEPRIYEAESGEWKAGEDRIMFLRVVAEKR